MKERVPFLVSDSAEHNIKQGFFCTLNYTQQRKQEFFTKYWKRVVMKVSGENLLIYN